MRSIPISMAILGFCVTAPIFGCFWSWFLTFQFSLDRLNVFVWLLLNPSLYMALAIYYQRRSTRTHLQQWAEVIDTILAGLGIFFVFAALVSTYQAYRVAIWTIDYIPADTVAGGDVAIMMLVGIINGVLIGLAILTVGYHLIPKDRRKQKV